MSDAASTTSTSRVTPSASGAATLETERGRTTIADSVVAKIAALATREVGGVASVGGGAAAAFTSVVGRMRSPEHSTAGVSVEVGEREAAIDITARVTYPSPIAEVAEAVRSNVIDRVESMTGLHVVEVNVNVTDLDFPGDDDESA